MRLDTLVVEPLREMILQVVSYIPTLLIALGILIIGCAAAHIIERLITRILKTIKFDKITDKLGIAKALRSGGVRRTPSEAIGCVTYCVFMVMVLVLTMKALGMTLVTDVIDKILAYVPHVMTGVLTLIIGMYVARFMSILVYIASKNTNMPAPATLSRVTKLVIMAYVSIIFLKEIGFVALFAGAHYTIFIGGLVFALALAFGLAGKDIAARYLDVFKVKKVTHK